MKIIALIPARYESTRFPGKLLKKLGDKTVISHTYDAAVSSKLFDDVFVITNNKDIYNEIKKRQGKVFISKKNHKTGTDRIAEFAQNIDADIFLNIQGDEPFINKEQLQSLIKIFKDDTEQKVDIASLMIKINKPEIFNNPNNVKVVFDRNRFALYFSRATIPYSREKKFNTAYKHIGVYAFRKSALIKISNLEETDLEKIEKLENLRFLENGFKIKMVETDKINFGIDTPNDLEQAEKYMNNLKKNLL